METMRHLFSVQDKTVLITGGSSGIGAMIARGFVANGARVYISARNQDGCDRMVRELSPLGWCRSLAADLSGLAGIRGLADALAAHEERLDVLVNNAGIVVSQPLDQFGEEAWDDVLDVNLKAPFFLIQQLLPLLRRSATGDAPARVINIASVNGIVPLAQEIYSYCAAKAGIIMVTRHLAKRLAAENILVNAIAPGPFPTRMMEKRLAEHGDAVRRANPLGRIGTGEDVAGVALFLASRASAFTTGAVVPCDGGLSTL